MEVVEFGPLSDAQRAELEGDEADPFDAAGMTLEYRAKERRVALQDDGRLAASAGLTAAAVHVGGEHTSRLSASAVSSSMRSGADAGSHGVS